MSIQYVNTGSSPNKGDGDSLRTAFGKINYNFSQFEGMINGSSATISINAFPPVNPGEGELWYDTVSGRSFIYYDDFWVDANPTSVEPMVVANSPVSSTSTGTTGTIAYNESYFYVCTATNSWQRIAWDSTPW